MGDAADIKSAPYLFCPECGRDSEWLRGYRAKSGLCYRRRKCRTCSATYTVVIGVLAGNELLCDAIGWYDDQSGRAA